MSREIQKYIPAGPVTQALHYSDAVVRLIMGPIGSGKSYACMSELHRRAMQQAPDKHGIRKSRWALIRNSYPELRDTTVKTWLDIYPEHTFGKLHQTSPMRHHHKFKMSDGTTVDAEFIFLSIDHEEDESKLMSLELTGAFINEARYINKSVLNKLLGRIGRYPAVKHGGCTWKGILMDTNPPNVTHWIYKKFVTERVDGWEFFHQPSGMSEYAENRVNLAEDYYELASMGQTEAFINSYVHGQFSYSEGQAPIHPKFSPTANVMTGIKVSHSFQTYVGMDFGNTPALVIIQHDRANNQYIVTDEICMFGASAEDIVDALKQLQKVRYRGIRMSYWGDPAGNQPSQTRRETVFDVIASLGIPIEPAAKNNNFDVRKNALDHVLNRKAVTGGECFIVAAHCTTLIAGLSGAYHFKKIQGSEGVVYSESPAKTDESHVCEALHYGLLGAGLGDIVTAPDLTRRKRSRPLHVINSRGKKRRVGS